MPSAAASAARIGPNAITRVAQVLPAQVGEAATRALFEQAGIAHHLDHPPEAMVDEAEVCRLHQALRLRLAPAQARAVAHAAGLLTGDYLLARRIPRPVQTLLKALPAPLAARVLLDAIGRHAWTFAGSGRFESRPGRPVRLQIVHNPLCRGGAAAAPAAEPVCAFYAATFERLFSTLVHRAARVRETACEACGDSACRFEIDW